MNQESLEKMYDLLFTAINVADDKTIPAVDRLEFLKNVRSFIDHYDHNIKILQKDYNTNFKWPDKSK